MPNIYLKYLKLKYLLKINLIFIIFLTILLVKCKQLTNPQLKTKLLSREIIAVTFHITPQQS